MKNLSKGCADSYPLHSVYIFLNTTNNESIAICDHDFEPAIEVHPPGNDGWEGFCLLYQCDEPWVDKEYVVENNDELLHLLSSGISQVLFDYFNKENCSKLIEFIRDVGPNERLTISKLSGGL